MSVSCAFEEPLETFSSAEDSCVKGTRRPSIKKAMEKLKQESEGMTGEEKAEAEKNAQPPTTDIASS